MTIETIEGPIEQDAPCYVQITEKSILRCEQLVEGRVVADYDADGELVGIEVIG